MQSRVLIIIVIFLALLLGGLLGRIIRITSEPVPSIMFRDDHRSLIPVVRVTGVEDGSIIGSAQGEVRVFFGDRVVIPDASGSFRVPAGDLLREVTTVRVPAGMRFVASKRGKKFYPVTSASAAKLAPQNRVYFPDEASAERAGFSSGQ